MALHIIGMPIGYGAEKIGSNLAPDKLREMNIIPLLKNSGYNVEDLGNIDVLDIDEGQKYCFSKNLKYYHGVVDANTKLASKVYESISTGNFPLIIGGDHSLGLGSIAGVSKYVKNLGVVWIDAHGDLNTNETTPSGNIHGMPLAASMGKGFHGLVNLFENRVKIKDKNIVHIGGRDFDPGEIELIKNSDIKAFTMDNIKMYGIDKIIDESINYLRGKVDGIHVSFDIDSIDSQFVPGTGTPVKDGLTLDEAEKVLKAFANSGLMVSLDFVEFNPLLDRDNITANISLDLLGCVFKNLYNPVYRELMLG